jgi:1-acyl-sn-glycerol-3-phosphate acyltransferase
MTNRPTHVDPLATRVADAPPTRRDAWYFRLLATGFAFFLFGLCGLLFRFGVYPVLMLAVRAHDRRQTLVRSLIRWFFRAYIELLVQLRLFTYTIEHAERLQCRGTVIVANHPSLLDVVLLVAFVPDACCVVKQALLSNPFMSGPLRAAGYIDNSDPLQMLERARTNLLAGSPIVIFPEGTRTEPGTRPVFGRSAANLSVRTGHPVPVFIRVEPTTLTRNERWYEVPYRRVRFTLTVGPVCEASQGGQPEAPPTVQVRRQHDRIMVFMNHMLDSQDSPLPEPGQTRDARP